MRYSEADALNLDDARPAIALRVNDLDAAVQWYASVFAREPKRRGIDRSLSGATNRFAAFTLAGLTLILSETASGTCRYADAPTVVFFTRRPLSDISAELVRRGATPDASEVGGFPAAEDGVRAGHDAEFLWLHDPDGNRLEFCRALSPASQTYDSRLRPRRWCPTKRTP
jgi:catechol 2,3-dioxygenase-like lactoylglutathione lyase family enzyme